MVKKTGLFGRNRTAGYAPLPSGYRGPNHEFPDTKKAAERSAVTPPLEVPNPPPRWLDKGKNSRRQLQTNQPTKGTHPELNSARKTSVVRSQVVTRHTATADDNRKGHRPQRRYSCCHPTEPTCHSRPSTMCNYGTTPSIDHITQGE